MGFQKCVVDVCLVVFMMDMAQGMGSLPGSCVAAGYTECCHDGCAGVPETCFCDPSCEEFGDCCSDIHLICNPARDAALDSLTPVIKYLDSITFHSASFHWIAIHDNYNLSGTYQVFLVRVEDASNSSAPLLGGVLSGRQYSLSVVINSTGANDISRKYDIELSGLEEGAKYVYKMSVITDIGSTEKLSNGTLSTKKYPNITADLQLAGASSVHMTWLRPEVPVGVTITQYKVYYRETTKGSRTEMVQVSPPQTSATLHSLQPHRSYTFQVAAEVQEANSRVYEFRGTGTGLKIFVPATTLFQIVTEASLACEDWNIQFEENVISLLQWKVTSLLQDACSCGYPKEHIQDQTLILSCINQRDRIFMQVTYRASLQSIPGRTVQQLLDSIETWINSSSAIIEKRTEKAGNDSSLILRKLKSCPVRIDHRNVPLCKTQSQDCEVTVSTLVALLLTEFVFFLVIFVATVLVTVYFSKARRKRYDIQESVCQVRTAVNSSSLRCKKLQGKDTASSQPSTLQDSASSEHYQHQGSVKYIL